jgi:hypothetical protein
MKNLFLLLIFSFPQYCHAQFCQDQSFYYQNGCQTYQNSCQSYYWSPVQSYYSGCSPAQSYVPAQKYYAPAQNKTKANVVPHKNSDPIPERIPFIEDVTPEKIDTPLSFKTKRNENLTLIVPRTMQVQNIVYVKVKVSSGELMEIPLVNYKFPRINGNVLTYSEDGIEYAERHYNILLTKGYLQYKLSNPNNNTFLAGKE